MPKSVPKKTSKRPLIFASVGVINTVLDFSFYTVLTSIVFSDHKNIALAGIISGSVALIIAFGLHSTITWRDHPINRQTFIRFTLFTGFGQWAIRPILLTLFIRLSGLYRLAHSLSHTLHLPFSYNFIANTGAFGFMTLIILFYNYMVYSRFVFKTKKPS